MCELSGEKAGAVSAVVLPRVRSTGNEPSALSSQMSRFPVAPLERAILRPLGEYAGPSLALPRLAVMLEGLSPAGLTTKTFEPPAL